MFFFFQAEDGIRDDLVTGVQTCALPIFALGEVARHRPDLLLLLRQLEIHGVTPGAAPSPSAPPRARGRRRSEERRVGKECRSRWATYHEKKTIERDTNKRRYTVNDIRVI